MTHSLIKTFVLGVAATALAATAVIAQNAPRYRDVPLGASLQTVLTTIGGTMLDVKVLHERPAKMQTLEWRPRPMLSQSREAAADPVQLAVFSFYNDQLFAVTVDYDTRRTEGLSETDLIDSISATYGLPPVAPVRKRNDSGNEGDPYAPRVLASWKDPIYSITLLRTTYPTAFRMVLDFTELASIARRADLEAVRLNALEAPGRELARAKKEADEQDAAREKSRGVNKPAFTP
jgi:hypothetical protein